MRKSQSMPIRFASNAAFSRWIYVVCPRHVWFLFRADNLSVRTMAARLAELVRRIPKHNRGLGGAWKLREWNSPEGRALSAAIRQHSTRSHVRDSEEMPSEIAGIGVRSAIQLARLWSWRGRVIRRCGACGHFRRLQTDDHDGNRAERP
jgi:hypothetical protein